MGLKLLSIRLLLPALEATRRVPDARILLLGTQDLYFTYDQAVAFLEGQGITVQAVPVAERRCTDSFAFASHDEWWKYKNYLHQKTFFRLLGFEDDQLHTLDISDYEHAEIIHDLNCPLPADMGSYDLVMDFGTLEHVFNIQQAMWNICDLVKPGGQVVHLMPANMIEHGFYNFNSAFLADFYGQAGWNKQELAFIASPTTDTGSRALYVRMEPGALETPPGGFYLGLFGHFTKPNGSSRKPVPKQGLYGVLHEAWTHQSRAQSRHEPPTPRPGDRLRQFASGLRTAFAYRRAQWAARHLKGTVVVVEEPAARRAGSSG